MILVFHLVVLNMDTNGFYACEYHFAVNISPLPMDPNWWTPLKSALAYFTDLKSGLHTTKQTST